MFGYEFVWVTWALTKYDAQATKFDGPGKWVFFKTVYWELHDKKKIYYADEAISDHDVNADDQ